MRAAIAAPSPTKAVSNSGWSGPIPRARQKASQAPGRWAADANTTSNSTERRKPARGRPYASSLSWTTAQRAAKAAGVRYDASHPSAQRDPYRGSGTLNGRGSEGGSEQAPVSSLVVNPFAGPQGAHHGHCLFDHGDPYTGVGIGDAVVRPGPSRLSILRADAQPELSASA